jgi:hypothetical protein
MVYLALVSSIVISFELSPLSNEFPNEFLLIGIFFGELQVFNYFVCVCCYLQEGMCSSLWFFFVATYRDAMT